MPPAPHSSALTPASAMAQGRGIDRALLPPKLYYFLYYAASACLMPFLALYYRQVGLSGPEIGWLMGVSPVVTWFAAPLWGALADATRRYRLVLTVTILAAMGMVALLMQAQRLVWLLPIVALYAFFAAPVMPLVDASVMALLGERSALYGRQRIWGAVGWGVTGAAAGILVERFGLTAGFAGYLALTAVGLVVLSQLRIAPVTIGQPFWAGVRTLTRNRPLIVFLTAVLFAGMGSSMVNNYLFLYLADLGASSTLMGLSLTFATASELPVFFFSGWLLRKYGARGMLMLAMAAYVVRLLALAGMPAAEWVLPINLLHGLTFAALWVAGVSYANQVAPPGMGATAQGLFTGMTMGLGSAAGAVLGGMLYDSLGPVTAYRMAALWVAVGLVFFVVAGRTPPAQSADAATEPNR